jgi:hypothetical protein
VQAELPLRTHETEIADVHHSNSAVTLNELRDAHYSEIVLVSAKSESGDMSASKPTVRDHFVLGRIRGPRTSWNR